MHGPFETARIDGERVAEEKIAESHKIVDFEGLKGGVGEHGGGLGHFLESDDGSQGRALDKLDAETHSGRRGDADGLWSDDVHQCLGEAQAENAAGFPLAFGQGLYGAVPDIDEIG